MNSHLRSTCLLLLLLAAMTATVCAEELIAESTEHAESVAVDAGATAPASTAEDDPTFEILDFRIVGNTLFPTVRLLNLLDDLTGPGRTAADVEKARDLLEKYHHEQGYPTVLVNIPEQSAASGVIKLQVIESRIGAATVSGSRYYATRRILDRLPSLAPGTILHVPDVQREMGRLNRTADLKVVPAMTPGKELGLVDVELKAEDKLPLHGSIELSNRAGNDTSELRLNAALHYDNLWDRDHSFSFQYQTSPEKPSEVEVFSASYILPAPWNVDSSLVLYGVHSDSETAFGEGFKTLGKGDILGIRYIMPLTPFGDYGHNAVAGFDYKKFDETTGKDGALDGTANTPVEYLPFSLAYNGSLPDTGGLTSWSATFNLSIRELVTNQQNLANKRYKAKGNYLDAVMSIERRQKLPAGLGLTVKIDGQVANQPLISNEQFTAGGMESVRGYKESEVSGDNALHGVAEFSAPNLAPLVKLGEGFQLTPYTFFDMALLWIKEPLPSQKREFNLQGAGVGIRGTLFRTLEFQTDWGVALSSAGKVANGDSRVYFRVKYQF